MTTQTNLADKTTDPICGTPSGKQSAFFADLQNRSNLPVLLDEIRDGLGTSKMTLQEMVQEMRLIRESSDYDSLK